jgi:hypothetical protein
MHDGAFTTLTAVLEHYSRATTSALNYNPGQLPVLYQPLVDTDVGRNQERVDALDPALNPPPTLGAQEIADLLEFLSALDDPTPPPAAPSSVASGLPVD